MGRSMPGQTESKSSTAPGFRALELARSQFQTRSSLRARHFRQQPSWKKLPRWSLSWSAATPYTRRATIAAGSQVEEYNKSMQRQMGWDERDPYKYYPERGLFYHEVWPDLFCGTQPRSADDIDQLADLLGPKGAILSLQQDKDLDHWGVNIGDLQGRASHRRLEYVRRPAVDFDANSLRYTLPGAVAALHQQLSQGRKVYVHCTAGLGRAPAVCIAYLYWYHNFQLQSAYSHVTEIRPCGPKWDAIRGSTYDLLDNRGWDTFESLPPFSFTELNDGDKANLQKRLAQM